MRIKKRVLLLFILPPLLVYALIFLYPVTRTAVMSIFSMRSISSNISTWTWAGLDNYRALFATRSFLPSLVTIGKIWLFCGIAVFVAALFFAVVLTSGVKLKGFFRAVIYLPNVISGIAIAYMWQLYVFNSNFGMFKSLFTSLGWEQAARFPWLAPSHVFLSMCIAYVFSCVGYFMLTYMSAIEGVPEDYFEAATIEGATRAQQFRFITLPLIKGTLVSTITIWTTRVMGFFALSRVFSDVSTQTPMLVTYRLLFGTAETVEGINVGMATASAVVMTVVIVIIFVITNLFIKTEHYEY